jgi:hypothetical protein
MKTTIFIVISCTILFYSTVQTFAQELYKFPEGVQTRWASPENPKAEKGMAAQVNAGRKGRPCLPLKAGESYVLAEAKGTSGTIRRIWITINDRSPRMLRGLRLDFFWDGAAKPAVSAPIGDFFGMGLGKKAPFETGIFSDPEGRSFNCRVPMPFKTGMEMVITNESGVDLSSLYYDVDFTVGDKHGKDVLYFHAFFNRENPTTIRKDYQILPLVAGRGRFIGSNLGVIANKELYYSSWWGEGEVKVYLDGDQEWPTLSGTGTEDYIGTGWGQGHYSQQYQGCHFADHEKMQYCFYRYHIPDPIYFQKDVRVTIQQIGCWDPQSKPLFRDSNRLLYHTGGDWRKVDFTDLDKISPYGLFERQDDWSSCAYFYLDKPQNDLPELIKVEKRIEGLE